MVLKFDLDIWRGNQRIVPDVYHLFLPEQSLICSSLWIGRSHSDGYRNIQLVVTFFRIFEYRFSVHFCLFLV